MPAKKSKNTLRKADPQANLISKPDHYSETKPVDEKVEQPVYVYDHTPDGPDEEDKPTIHEELARLQKELIVTKDQYNDFSSFSYRSAEGILAALKPLLNGLTIILSDEIISVRDRVYVKSTAILSNGKETIEVSAFARETFSRKGMDDSQVTGSTSSYARKYALNGLFGLNDDKDADSMNNTAIEEKVETQFNLDDEAMNWVNYILLDMARLDEIKDPAYRNFIQQEVAKR